MNKLYSHLNLPCIINFLNDDKRQGECLNSSMIVLFILHPDGCLVLAHSLPLPPGVLLNTKVWLNLIILRSLLGLLTRLRIQNAFIHIKRTKDDKLLIEQRCANSEG